MPPTAHTSLAADPQSVTSWPLVARGDCVQALPSNASTMPRSPTAYTCDASAPHTLKICPLSVVPLATLDHCAPFQCRIVGTGGASAEPPTAHTSFAEAPQMPERVPVKPVGAAVCVH